MPSNDTENIYSSPPTAEEVSYDNDLSQLTATNVQDAIDEVNTDLQSTKDDVTDLKNELRDKYLFASRGSVSAIGDGTKTYGDIINELATKFVTFLSTLEDDEYVMVQSLTGGYLATSLYPHNLYNKDSDFSTLSFIGLTFTDSWTTSVLHLIRISTSLSNCKWLQSNLGTSTQTFSNNMLSSIFTNELALEMRYIVYKKV